METVFAIAMLLGGPLFGRFGDLFGARSALLVAFTSSLLTYLVLAVANSIPALFLSRIFAFMMHAMHGTFLSNFSSYVLLLEIFYNYRGADGDD